MKKKTQRNCKKGGSRSGSSGSSSSVGYEKFKIENPEIMSVYNNANETKGSLGVGIIGGVCALGLVIFAIYKRK
jgi:hypothetical protein